MGKKNLSYFQSSFYSGILDTQFRNVEDRHFKILLITACLGTLKQQQK